MQPTDTLHFRMTPRSYVLCGARPWLYRIGDFVRLESGEVVQVLDGFLHVRRAVGSVAPTYCPAGTKALIIRSVSEGASL